MGVGSMGVSLKTDLNILFSLFIGYPQQETVSNGMPIAICPLVDVRFGCILQGANPSPSENLTAAYGIQTSVTAVSC